MRLTFKVSMILRKNPTIAVVGLGYVGLPLAVEFGKKLDVVGYDVSVKRVLELKQNIDRTLEITKEELGASQHLKLSSDQDTLHDRDVYIITVPTPVDSSNTPDLTALKNASRLVGQYLRKGSIVIYESTVYPGATEEVCVPILEETSGYKMNKEFFCGYSPERINPGDKTRKLKDIKKIVSGSNDEIGIFIQNLYNEIISAGTFLASSIKVAEAAKVIENTQRDLNIALMNELALIFEKLEIDTLDVLKAAETKWNFMPFRPGLVGGHCIGVDPYYLVHKAQQVGYYPEIISAGRRVNNEISEHISLKVVKILLKKKIQLIGCKVIILGFAFKENCTDYRNSKVVDLYKNLIDYGLHVDLYDPWVDAAGVMEEYGIKILSQIESPEKYSAAIFAVGHDEFRNNGIDFYKEKLLKKNSVVYDVKGIFDPKMIDCRL